ncbi:hypothetical protein LC612_43720 [Nostoc sp. CHAB 5834]|nr:hypothetical protein [Nostoc sp. CHAB 5834]
MVAAMNKEKDPNKIYGQTISFRYFTNKHLNPRPFLWSSGEVQDSYPLYIEVKAKRQTSQRRSIVNAYVVPNRLEQFLRNNEHDITTEITSLRRRILAQKPFESSNFNLSKALEGYSVFQEDIVYVIGDLLREEYYNARRQDSINLLRSDLLYALPDLYAEWGDPNDEEYIFYAIEEQAGEILYRGTSTELIDPQVVFMEVRDLSVPGKPNVTALYDRYKKHFWGLDRYCSTIRTHTLHKVITFEDFMSPKFEKLFISYFKKEVWESVLEGFEQLKEDKPELKRKLTAVDM